MSKAHKLLRFCPIDGTDLEPLFDADGMNSALCKTHGRISVDVMMVSRKNVGMTVSYTVSRDVLED